MSSPLKYDSATIERVCGADAARYAANKHRGGLAGQKGWRFEVLYAAYRIATEANKACLSSKTGEDVWFQDQVGGFVDDLAVVTEVGAILSQAKSGGVSWTAGEHPLATDFRLQDKLDKAANRPACYELVVSTDEVGTVMEESRPSDLSGVCVTVFRGAGDDLLGLFGGQPELVEALDGISLRPPQNIVREQTFQAILGAWVHSKGEGRLKDILAAIAARPDALIRVAGPDYEVPAAVIEALQRVQGLGWRISGMHLSYEVGGGRLTGWAAYPCNSERFREFERFIIESRTNRWMDVVSALRKEG